MKASLLPALAILNALATLGMVGWGLLTVVLWRMDALYQTPWYLGLERSQREEIDRFIDAELQWSVLPLVIVSLAWLVLATCYAWSTRRRAPVVTERHTE